ncbi:MAG: hypothetical protein JWN25_1500 [Verrucomicrobiales bacterium]|nr:hypothetical protein [Verrucomicrobiales bacterium]
MKSLFSLLGCAALALAVSESHSSATIVFNNTTGDLGKDFVVPTSVEVGDEIKLSTGASAILTNFNFQYFLTGTTTGNESARVRFYKNDGAPSSAGPNTPSTVLFDSGFFHIDPTTRLVLTFDSSVGAPFPLVVPNDFTWSIVFNNLDPAGTAGLTLYNPPSVGLDSAEYWDKSSGSWVLKSAANGSSINFAAQVQAVPEPGTFALIGLAGLGLAAARRFRKN